jgi:hypothetical protein
VWYTSEFLGAGRQDPVGWAFGQLERYLSHKKFMILIIAQMFAPSNSQAMAGAAIF